MEKRDKYSSSVKAISLVKTECNLVDILQRLADFGNENIFANFDLAIELRDKKAGA